MHLAAFILASAALVVAASGKKNTDQSRHKVRIDEDDRRAHVQPVIVDILEAVKTGQTGKKREETELQILTLKERLPEVTRPKLKQRKRPMRKHNHRRLIRRGIEPDLEKQAFNAEAEADATTFEGTGQDQDEDEDQGQNQDDEAQYEAEGAAPASDVNLDGPVKALGPTHGPPWYQIFWPARQWSQNYYGLPAVLTDRREDVLPDRSVDIVPDRSVDGTWAHSPPYAPEQLAGAGRRPGGP